MTVCAVLPGFELFGDSGCRPGATEESDGKGALAGQASAALTATTGARVDYILRVPSGVRVNSQNSRGEVRQHLPAGGDGLNLARIPREPQPCPNTRRY